MDAGCWELILDARWVDWFELALESKKEVVVGRIQVHSVKVGGRRLEVGGRSRNGRVFLGWYGSELLLQSPKQNTDRQTERQTMTLEGLDWAGAGRIGMGMDGMDGLEMRVKRF